DSLDVLSALRTTRACARSGATRRPARAEHRAENISQSAEATDVEVFESETLRPPGSCARTTASARTIARAEATARPKPPHLIVLCSLLGVPQYLIGLGDRLEGLGGLWVVGVFVRVMLRGELAVLLFDLVLRCGRRNTEDRVVVLRLGHRESVRTQPFHCFT